MNMMYLREEAFNLGNMNYFTMQRWKSGNRCDFDGFMRKN